MGGVREHPNLNMSSNHKTRFTDITFDRLLSLKGVTGAIHSETGKVVMKRTRLADAQATKLASLARGMCRGYRKAGRIPSRILVAYEGTAVLITSRDDTQLVLLLESKVDIDSISAAATSYVAKHTQRPLRLPPQKKASA